MGDGGHTQERPILVDRSTPLRGLPPVPVCIVVRDEVVRDDDSNSWIDTDQLQTDVELKLRGAGLKVTSTAQPYLCPAVLIIEVGGFAYDNTGGFLQTVSQKNELDLYYYSVTLSVKEFAVLQRDPSIMLLAKTWSRQTAQDGPKREAAIIRNLLSELVDILISSYLAANLCQTDNVH